MGLDLNFDYNSVQNKINATKSYTDLKGQYDDTTKKAGEAFENAKSDITGQIQNLKNQSKRYQKEIKTQLEQLLDINKITGGKGGNSTKYVKRLFLTALKNIEPKIAKILSEEALNAVGCDQQQSFSAQTIYIKVKSIDLINLLKLSPTEDDGKPLYEKQQIDVQNYPFAMNKELYELIQTGNPYSTTNGQLYKGQSGQNLFDIQYVEKDNFFVTGPWYKVTLQDRIGIGGGTINKVGEFMVDYFKTIKVVDTTNIMANIMEALSGAVSIKANAGIGQIGDQTKFGAIVQRILGLCFDNRKEIDVSGIAKLADLDGVDESFFELTEIDLRNIDVQISNIQNGVMELVDCDNVKLPVDYETIIDGLIELRETENLSPALEVNKIIAISDSLVQNPDWKVLLPTNLNFQVFDEDFIKKIPLSVAGAVLSPKVLFPIFVLMQSLETNATNVYNSAVTSANTFTQSGNTIGNSVNNLINSNVDFLKTFKKFNIEMVAEIGAIFVTELFNILKKDLINLMKPIIADIGSEALKAKLQMIERLITIALIINQIVIAVKDYKKCKSLIDDILIILNLISSLAPPGSKIPKVLLLLANFLPGTSASRASINTIEELQKLGIPTGTLPDGSPNLMLLFNLASNKGTKKESAQNGKIQAIGISADGKPVRISGKST